MTTVKSLLFRMEFGLLVRPLGRSPGTEDVF